MRALIWSGSVDGARCMRVRKDPRCPVQEVVLD